MASSPFPSTPKATPATPSQEPGKWRHPRLDEIVRRQNAATFSDRNLKKLLWNGAALFATAFIGDSFRSYAFRLQKLLSLQTYPEICLLVLRLFFVMNILIALYPLFGPKDDLSDIPLTPTQRALLGLDPTATPPATAGTEYVTPPRYRLSAGSRQASPASRSTSPLSANGTVSGRNSTGPSFSPSPSPLFQKAVTNGSRENGRRSSIGSSSSLGSSSLFGDSTFSRAPATPSPVERKRSSLGVSNKWLYEKSRRLSAGSGVL